MEPGLGSSKSPQHFWDLSRTCSKCRKRVAALKEMFCANFGASRGYFAPYLNTLCGTCYRMLGS
eukprot:7714744-Ditylum_brightwellii.AAC.1